jgi:hypothetical protein
MGNKYEITEKQLTFLEGYIKKKKASTEPEDIYELMDHLINDFEATTEDGNLSQYLSGKSRFIFKYGTDKESKIHWAYQKELWNTVFSFFTNIRTLSISIIITIILLKITLTLSEKQLFLVFMSSIVFQIFYGLYLTYHENKKVRKLISFKYLGNIMALPQVSLYSLTIVKDFLITHRFLFFLYWLIAFSLSIAGLIVIKNKKETILKKYKHLLN